MKNPSFSLFSSGQLGSRQRSTFPDPQPGIIHLGRVSQGRTSQSSPATFARPGREYGDARASKPEPGAGHPLLVPKVPEAQGTQRETRESAGRAVPPFSLLFEPFPPVLFLTEPWLQKMSLRFFPCDLFTDSRKEGCFLYPPGRQCHFQHTHPQNLFNKKFQH